MRKNKDEFTKFMIWMRNGTAFCTTWFLILMLIYHSIHNLSSIPTNLLVKMILLSIGGVFLFSSFFTCLFIKRWHFVKRLTGFMLVISLYECFCFYALGVFQNSGTVIEWFVFAGIILALYFCCITIYQRYSKKQGELYTKSLQEYQQKRSIENGK